MIVAIERRPQIKILDRIVGPISDAGFKVIRCDSPMHSRVTKLPNCNVIVVFNGTHPKYNKIIKQAKNRNIKVIYIELGWLPQRPYNQVDFSGINADASWVNNKLPDRQYLPLKLRNNNKLLVPLQNDRDVSIRCQSPWFADMFGFLKHLKKCSCMHIVVRKHPRHAKKTDKQILKFVANNRKISWDKSATFLDALKGVRAVATVNSTAGLEAINAGYPVLCYGRAVYRREDVAICLENSKDDSKAAIKAIKHGDVSLNRANLQSFVKLVKSKQIHRKKTANVIISMLQGLR